MYEPFWLIDSLLEQEHRTQVLEGFKKVKNMDLKLLSDKELEILIYEYENEICDKRMYLKLLNERKRRSLDE